MSLFINHMVMTRFTVIFITLVITLFTLELLEPIRQIIILPFTSFLAFLSASIMQIFDADVLADHDILKSLSTGHAVQIAPGCNGIEAVIILFAAIFAFPAKIKYKLIGFVLGFIGIQALNLIRIISLYYLLQWDKNWFDWFHLYLWQALIILDALVIWLLWLRYLPQNSNAKSETSVIKE